MMDYYKILGVDRNADADQIKKAYRSLVKQHHPDRGGDSELFKQINQAYETLSDPVKRREYDNPQPQFRYDFDHGNFEDIIGAFFSQQMRAQMRNRDIKIAISLTLEEVLAGKNVTATYKLSNGEETSANIKIHPGVMHGEAIRFKNLGDRQFANIPPGDLIVYVKVFPHAEFEREGQHLKKIIELSVLDLILGKQINVRTLDSREIAVKVPRGTHPGTVLSVSGYGLPDLKSGRTGNLYLAIKSFTPKINDTDMLKKIKDIKDELDSST
jgi:DnaJ-class molecular chaperone